MNQEEYNQLILELIQELIKNQNEIIQLLSKADLRLSKATLVKVKRVKFNQNIK